MYPDFPRERSWLERQVKNVSRLWREIGRRTPERLWLAWVLVSMVLGKDYRSAQYAVRKAARDISPENMEGALLRMSKAQLSPYDGENWYRNAEAAHWTFLHAKENGRWIPSWRREALVEMAYLALKERGK